MRKAILLLLILAAFQQTLVAQENKEPGEGYRNTVHFNITNPILFGSRSLIFGYERVVNKRQSFSINFGSTGFPSMNIINTDSVKATKTGSKTDSMSQLTIAFIFLKKTSILLRMVFI